MENIILIEYISVIDNLLIIKPEHDCLDKIYRSAMGVHWDTSNKYLYFKLSNKQDREILKSFNLILQAVKDEYGKLLKIYLKTNYLNISENIKNEIIKSHC